MPITQIPVQSTNSPKVNETSSLNSANKVDSSAKPATPLVAVLSRQLPLPILQKYAGQTLLAQVVNGRPGGEAELQLGNQKVQVSFKGEQLNLPKNGETVLVRFQLNEEEQDKQKQQSNEKLRDPQGKELKQGLEGLRQDTKPQVQTQAQVPKNLLEKVLKEDLDLGRFLSTKTSVSKDGQLLGALVGTLKNPAPQSGFIIEAKSFELIAQKIMESLTQKYVNPVDSDGDQKNPGSQGKNGKEMGASNANTAGTTTSPVKTDPSKSGLETWKASTGLALLVEASPDTNGSTKGIIPESEIKDASKKMTEALARFVKSSVETSGIFYESHLKKWTEGRFSQESLSRELQNQPSFFKEGGLDSQEFENLLKKNQEALYPEPRRASSLVGSQLNTLHSGEFSFTVSGLFQNPFSLEFTREGEQESDNGKSTKDRSRPWIVSLKMTLANLGDIYLKIKWSQLGAEVNVVGSERVVSGFKEHWPAINTNLAGRNIPLAGAIFEKMEKIDD